MTWVIYFDLPRVIHVTYDKADSRARLRLGVENLRVHDRSGFRSENLRIRAAAAKSP